MGTRVMLAEYALDSGEDCVGWDGGEAFFLLLDAGFEIAAPAIGAVVEDFVTGAAGIPDDRAITRGEDGDAAGLDGGGEMHGAAVVAEENARARQHGGGDARRDTATEIECATLPICGGCVADGAFLGRSY